MVSRHGRQGAGKRGAGGDGDVGGSARDGRDWSYKNSELWQNAVQIAELAYALAASPGPEGQTGSENRAAGSAGAKLFDQLIAACMAIHDKLAESRAFPESDPRFEPLLRDLLSRVFVADSRATVAFRVGLIADRHQIAGKLMEHLAHQQSLVQSKLESLRRQNPRSRPASSSDPAAVKQS